MSLGSPATGVPPLVEAGVATPAHLQACPLLLLPGLPLLRADAAAPRRSRLVALSSSMSSALASPSETALLPATEIHSS